jgi:hypothetical protein
LDDLGQNFYGNQQIIVLSSAPDRLCSSDGCRVGCAFIRTRSSSAAAAKTTIQGVLVTTAGRAAHPR